jgi:sugar O-acyltransferase (sialic acid O-acetyltransferase NeuD family)
MRVVLVGGGGHASDILGVFEAAARAKGETTTPIAGIVADGDVDLRRFTHRGVGQIGYIDDLKSLDVSHYIIAVGFSLPRQKLQARVDAFGLRAASIIHPLADIPPSIPVGEGTVILSGVRMSPMAIVGRHVYLSHGCLIGHDCDIQDFVTVLPGAAVSGDTILGEASLIGTNASVVQGRTIGARAIVGAGAVVVKDVAPDITVVGSPAAPMQRR